MRYPKTAAPENYEASLAALENYQVLLVALVALRNPSQNHFSHKHKTTKKNMI